MPVILEKKYENNISLAVWQITESHDELQAMLPSEILTDAELASISHPQKQIEFFCSRLVIKHLANSLNIKYLGIKKDENGNLLPDGYACAKWLVYESGLDLKSLKFNVHSANPVAKVQIESLLKNYLKFLHQNH